MRRNTSGTEYEHSFSDLRATLRSTTALTGFAIAVVLTAGPAQAQQTSWTGTNSAIWSDLGNWTNGVPGPGDIVVLNAIAPHSPNIGPGIVGKALDLRVGVSTAGTLVVLGGGDLESGTASVGDSAFGVVTVTDGGSTWTNSSYLFVGEHGTGRLNIKAGGTVTTDGNASIGRDAGSVGAATVTGPGSTWTTNGFLRIGDLTGSHGALEIADQGVVTSIKQVRIADASGTQGTVLVTGTGSKWQGATQFHVGFKDEGSLTIADGGDVSSGFSTLGTWGSDTLGTVTVTGAGSSWTIGGGVLIVGHYGRGVLTIVDGATVSSAGAMLGSEEGSSGGVTVMGSTWTNMGDLDVGRESVGKLRIDAGGAVTNANGYIGREAGSTGTAAVVGIGSTWTNTGNLYVGDGGDGTLIIGPSGTVTATGVVSVADQPGSSGRVVVNGDLVATGGVDINTGGWLAGVGTVTGNIDVGGTIAPGNSIGTLDVVGPYTQAAGSTYEAEVNAAGGSDLIAVTGTATLNGGSVEVVPFPDFALATPYTILTATGGVTGTFADATVGSSAFLVPHLVHGTNDVVLTIMRGASFESAALTPNQRAAAGGADSLGAGNPIWDGIVLLSAAEAPAAFDAISGEVHASAASVLIEDSRFVREAVDARLRTAFSGVGADVAPVLAHGEAGLEVTPADSGRFAAWGHAFGSWGKWDSDGNAASLTRDTGGFVLGGDGPVADTWRLGLLAGYSSGAFDIAGRASSGSANSYHLGAYAGTGIGKWGLRFGGAYSWHAIDTARTAAFAGFTDTLSAEYNATTAQIFGEAGYRIDTDHASFEPFANLAYVNLHTDGFTESGGPAALTASSSSQNTTFTTLGLRAETALPLGDMTARLHGMLGWRHAFGDIVPTSDLAFAGGSAFTIAGVPVAEDAAIIEAGLDLTLSPGAKLGIAYNGQIGSGVSDHGAKANLTVKF